MIKSKIAEHYVDLAYVIAGVGGVGKTTTAYEMGKAYEGYDEGTIFCMCGREPDPPAANYYFQRCNKFEDILLFHKKVMEERETTFKHTKFIAYDSIDELIRLCEEYTIKKANEEAVAMATDKQPAKKVKSIKSAFGGFGGGIAYANDLLPKLFELAEKCGMKPIFIGHIKQKGTTDLFTGVTQEKITCSVAEKYYNTIKDKVNIACCLYTEKEFKDVKKVKGKFGGEDKEKGVVISEKRVCVFKDDGFAIDLKTHYPDIKPKVDMDRYCQNFIMAIEEAIEAKKNEEESRPRPMSFVERLKSKEGLSTVEVKEDILSVSKNVTSAAVDLEDVKADEEDEDGISKVMADAEGDVFDDDDITEEPEVEADEDDDVPFDKDPEVDEPVITTKEAFEAVKKAWSENPELKKKGLAHVKSKGIKDVKKIDEDTIMELFSMINE